MHRDQLVANHTHAGSPCTRACQISWSSNAGSSSGSGTTCTGKTTTTPDAGPDIVAANKDLLHRYHEDVWDQGHLEHSGMYLAPTFTSHAVVTTLPAGQQPGADFLAQFRIGFPDMRSHEDALLGDGDLVMIRFSVSRQPASRSP